ncbi:MAG TPA: PQQ-binding-like beta-propeller repeat protein [Streptosporangiaceae bacterium]
MAGAGLAAVAATVAACTGGGASSSSATQSASPPQRTLSPTTSPQAYPAAAWPTFNGNAARTGVVTGLPAAGRLSIAWKAHLDGTVYGQPLLIGDLVVAATENDTFYALNRSTGKVVWSRHVATPLPQSGQHGCGDIDPLGITGTPVYDQGNGLVYGVAQTSSYQHILFGVSVSDGAVKVERYIPTPDGQQAWDQQRPALAMADGRAYVSFGGLVGDCGPYIGSVVGVPLSGAGSLVSYRTLTTREGAVWGTAGPVIGPGGDFYVSIGNGAATSGRWDGSDSVNKLSPTLQRLSYFAPSYWAMDNADDYDLGSAQPALVDGDSLFSMGKRGIGYLLNATNLGGIGGQEADLPVCKPFGAASVDGSTVYEPCSSGGTAAIALNPASKTIRVLWRGPASADGSPVVGGGAVWVTDWNGETLYELSQSSGTVSQQISLGSGLPHFSSLTLGYGTAFVGTLDGVTAVSGA